jgi:hypothetical protein
MTHSDWNVRIKRALALADHKPTSALRTLTSLMHAVEVSLRNGVHDWHLAQTLHVMSIVQTGAGDHRAAAETLMQLTKQCESNMDYEIRAYVSACAATALELAQAEDRVGARRMLRKAGRVSFLLRPKDRLLDRAQKSIDARATRTRRRRAAR